MTPGQLVKAVSIALDVPEETVVQHDRNLVTAGLRTKGGRGPSAPKVTPLDAARLLVATLGSVRTKDSVETVRKFEETKHLPPKKSDLPILQDLVVAWRARGEATEMHENLLREGKFFSDPAITALPLVHSFVQALEALLVEASAPLSNLDDFLRRFAPMAVSCEVPRMLAHIGRVGELGSARYVIPVRTATEQPSSENEPVYKFFLHRFGIKQDRVISGTAIMLLGMAFRGDGLPFKTPKAAMDALLGTKKAPAKSKKGA
jgi:hypothetical protein